VGENIMLAPRIAKGLDPADVKKRATLVLEQVGLRGGSGNSDSRDKWSFCLRAA
jgi:ABC-type polar amino acid transport system ATPase subunit